jgi:hypothetical protein
VNFGKYQQQINFASGTGDKEYYVYELWDPIKNEPFYVGKGRYRKRYYRCLTHIKEAVGAVRHKGKNNHKYNRINKIFDQGGEPLIKIVFETNNESEAFKKEIELIKLYGRRDLKTGSLTNLTAGGEGGSGHKATIEQRQKMCERLKGSGNPMYGRKHTAEAIHAMSVARKAQKPTKHSQEWKDYLKTHCKQLSEYNIQPVYQIDLKGNVLNNFPSMKRAGELLGFNTYRNISYCCKNKHHTCMGFYWRLIDDPDVENGRLKNIDAINIKKSKPHHGGYTIFQYDSSGELLKKWNSILLVSKTTGIKYHLLYGALNKKILISDCYWERIKDL